MANRYWGGGAGTWSTTDTTHWYSDAGLTTLAGAVPTAADSVFFQQAATYTVTMTGALTCLDITVSAGVVTFATGTTPTLAVSGSMSLVAGTVWSSTGAITFNANTTGKTITTNAVTINGSITFNNANGGWSLGSTLTLGATLTTTLTSGTLTLNGFNLTTGIFSIGGVSTTAIAFGTNNIILAHTTAGTTVLNAPTLTNFTPTGTGGFTSVMSVTRTFNCGSTGGSSSNAPNLSLTSGASIPTISSLSIFSNLNFTGSTCTPAVTTVLVYGDLTLATGGTYTNLSITARGTSNIFSNSKTIAAFVVNNGAGTVTLQNASISCTTYTQTAGTIDLNSWNIACSSTATFTAGTLSNINTITCTTFTVNGAFAHTSGTITPSVSFITTSGSYTQSGTSILSAVSTFTQTAGDVTFRSTYALTATGTYTLTAGTLTLGGNLTTGTFSSTGTGTRSIVFGAFNIILATTTAAAVNLSMADATNFTYTSSGTYGSGTGCFQATMSATRTFTFGTTAGGSATNAPRLYLVSGISIATLTSGSWFGELDFGTTGYTTAATNLNLVSLKSDLSTSTLTSLTATMVGSGYIGTSASKSIGPLVINTAGITTTLASNPTLCTTATLTLGTLDLNLLTLTCSSTFTWNGGNLVTTLSTINCTTFTLNGPTFTFEQGTINPSTSFVVLSGIFVYGLSIGSGTLSAVPTFTQTAGTVTFNKSYALTATGTYTFTSGQLTLGNGVILTTGIFSSTGTGTRSLGLGSAISGGTGSISLDGVSGQYAQTTAANGGPLDLSTATSWTVECWVYLTVTTGAASAFWKGGGTGLNPSYALWFNTTTPQWIVGDGAGGGISQDLTSALVTANTWYHFALVRNGGFVTAYVNGVGQTPVAITSMGATPSTTLWAGAAVDQRYFPGNISNLRIVKGVAVYTGNFIVPQTSLTSTQSASGTNISAITGTQTSLLLNTVNGVNFLTDSSSFAYTMTNVGSSVSSALNPFVSYIKLAHTTLNTTVLSMADLTNLTFTGNGAFSSTMSVTRTFTCGSTAGSTTSAPNLSLISGASIPTLTTGGWFNNLDFTGSTCSPAATVLNIDGDLTLATGGTYTSLSINARGTGTITPNGKTIAALTVNNGSGTVTLASALGCTTYTQTAGTINFATFNLTCSSTALFTAGTLSNIGTLTCTTFTVNGVFAHSSGTITPSVSFVTTGGSYTQSGTSILSSVATFTQTAGDVTFRGAYTLSTNGTYTLTAGTLTLGGTLNTGIFSSSGTGTRSINFVAVGRTILLTHTTAGTTVLNMADLTNFTWTSNGRFLAAMSVTRTFTCGSTAGSATSAPNLYISSGASIPTLTTGGWFNNLDFTGSTCTPAVTTLNIDGDLTLATGGTYTSLSINSVGTGTITPNGKTLAAFVVNNGSGTVTLASALGCTTYTQTAGTIDFSTFNLTCSSTGLFTAGTLNNIGTLTCTTFTVNGAFAHTSGTITPSVSFITTSGSYTQSGTSILSAVSTFTQTAGDVTFRSTYALTATGTYTLTAGTLTLGGNLTTGIFNSTGVLVRSIAFSTYNIILTHSTAAQTVLNLPDVSNFTRTGTGGFSTAMSVTRTFNVATSTPSSNFGSLSFNGTNQYLTLPSSSTAWTFGTDAFTVEFWMYPTTLSSTSGVIISNWIAASGAYVTGQWEIACDNNASGQLAFTWATGLSSFSQITSGANLPTLNVWNHVAVVRSGTTITIYLNGVSVGSGTMSTSLGATGILAIGYQQVNTPQYYTGYLSNIRIVKGLAVYTGSFTPPKNVLTSTQDAGLNINAITGTQTSLLLKTPNTVDCLLDSSVNNFTVTNNNSVTPNSLTPVPVTYVTSGLINGSYNFNGSSQYLIAPIGSSTFGTGDFTVECWFYKTSAITCTILTNASTNDVNYWTVSTYADGHCQSTIRDATSQLIVIGSIIVPANTWAHVAVTRTSGLVRLFVNGVLDNSGTITKTVTARTTLIGSFQYPGFTEYFPGYISNVRLVTGLAVYTTSFTTPTSPFTAIQSANVNGNPSAAITSGQTTLLLNTYYGGLVSSILDGSLNNFTITNTGGTPSWPAAPPISTAAITVPTSNLVPSLFLTSGTSIPTFVNNSYFKDLDFTGSSTIPATTTVLVGEDLTLSTGGTYTGLTVIAANTGNYTSTGKSISDLYINTTSTATLLDAMSVSGIINLISGTLALSSFSLTSPYLISTGTLSRSITGSSTYSVTGSGTTVFYNASGTGLNITSNISMTSASTKVFAGGDGSYAILNQGGSGTLTISGNNSFADITATTRPSTISFTADSTQTVTNFTLSGTAGNLVTINSTVSGTRFNLTRITGTTNVDYLNITDSYAYGGSGWYPGTNSTNGGNNLGWLFTVGTSSLGNFFVFF